MFFVALAQSIGAKAKGNKKTTVKKGGTRRFRAASVAWCDITRRSLPIRRRKNNRPKLGVRVIELEGYRKKIEWVIFHADHSAVLLYAVLRIHETHGLADVHVHFHLEQAAVGVHHQRQRFFLTWLALLVFRDHRDLHLEHHALASPAVHRIGRTCQALLLGLGLRDRGSPSAHSSFAATTLI